MAVHGPRPRLRGPTPRHPRVALGRGDVSGRTTQSRHPPLHHRRLARARRQRALSLRATGLGAAIEPPIRALASAARNGPAMLRPCYTPVERTMMARNAAAYDA